MYIGLNVHCMVRRKKYVTSNPVLLYKEESTYPVVKVFSTTTPFVASIQTDVIWMVWITIFFYAYKEKNIIHSFIEYPFCLILVSLRKD